VQSKETILLNKKEGFCSSNHILKHNYEKKKTSYSVTHTIFETTPIIPKIFANCAPLANFLTFCVNLFSRIHQNFHIFFNRILSGATLKEVSREPLYSPYSVIYNHRQNC